MYVERKPSLYIEDLRHEFNSNINNFKIAMKPLIH